MDSSHKEIRPLLTGPEIELFEASLQTGERQPGGSVRSKAILRARALRNKYRDLCRRQTAHRRRRANEARDGNENARTLRKSEIMAEVLARFEAMRTGPQGGTCRR